MKESSAEFQILNSYLEWLKNKQIGSFETDIRSLLERHMNYEIGKKKCMEYFFRQGFTEWESKKSFKLVPVSNVLIISLLDIIPENADIFIIIKDTFYGCELAHLKEKNTHVLARYTGEIHLFLLSFAGAVTAKNKEQIERSKYFISFLKNRSLSSERDQEIITPEQLQKVNTKRLSGWDDISITEFKDIPPLNDIISWGDLNRLCKCNIRKFLHLIFDVSLEFTDAITSLCFHDTGIFYLTKDEKMIGFLGANNKYIDYFDNKTEHHSFNLSIKKWIVRNKLVEDYEKTVKKLVSDLINSSFTQVVTKEIGNIPPIDAFIMEMQDIFEVPVYQKNIWNFPELQDSQLLGKLLETFTSLESLVRIYFKEGMMFGKQWNRKMYSEIQKIAAQSKHEQDQFLNPRFVESFLNGTNDELGNPKHSDIYLHEIEYLSHHEWYYPFFVHVLFARIFKKILHFSKTDPQYQGLILEFKGLLWGQLDKEIKAMQSIGYDPRSPLTEKAVLLNYFMKLWTGYIMDRQGKPLRMTLDDNIKKFFLTKVLQEHEKLENLK